MTAKPYRSELLSGEHNRQAFSCGVEDLDRYFRERVGQDRRRNLTIPYVLVDTTTGDVAGYYTLCNYAIVPARLPREITKGLPPYDA